MLPSPSFQINYGFFYSLIFSGLQSVVERLEYIIFRFYILQSYLPCREVSIVTSLLCENKLHSFYFFFLNIMLLSQRHEVTINTYPQRAGNSVICNYKILVLNCFPLLGPNNSVVKVLDILLLPISCEFEQLQDGY